MSFILVPNQSDGMNEIGKSVRRVVASSVTPINAAEIQFSKRHTMKSLQSLYVFRSSSPGAVPYPEYIIPVIVVVVVVVIVKVMVSR